MPKSSAQQLVNDEKKIIEVLKTNANESIDVIAKKCGFSRQKVWRIIKKIEKQEKIWGYTAICNDEDYDLRHFTMLMKRTTIPIDRKMIQEILTTRLDDLIPGSLIKIETIEYVHGCYDGVITFLAKDLITAKKFCDQFQSRFHEFSADVELLEGIFFVRKQMLRNPNLKNQIEFL